MGVGETVGEEERRIRRQMGQEEEVEVRVGTACCGFRFCPETMICHFLSTREDSGGTFRREASPWPMDTWSGYI